MERACHPSVAPEDADGRESGRARIESRYECWPLTTEECDACESVLAESRHSVLFPLPNHHINSGGNQRGFLFECSAKDSVRAMPIGGDMFSLRCLYECQVDGKKSTNGCGDALHADALRVFNDRLWFQNTLQTFVTGLGERDERPASFDCICEDHGGSRYTHRAADQRLWRPSVPARVGLYHAFVRTHTKDAMEHKLFIGVSGHLHVACEELQNLWHDLRQHSMTCEEFVESEECQWLRQATMRNHGKIAHEVAALLGLRVDTRVDMDSASGGERVAIPIVSGYENDVCVGKDSGRVRVSDCACLLPRTTNGVLFEMFPSEGFWLFQGPKDYACDLVYGTVVERDRRVPALPARTMEMCRVHATGGAHTVRADGSRWFFPDKRFTHELERLGFNRDDGIVHLMPVVQVVSR